MEIRILKSEVIYEIASAAYIAAGTAAGLTEAARTGLKDVAEPENLHLLERFLDEGASEGAVLAGMSLERSGGDEPSEGPALSDILRRPCVWTFRNALTVSAETGDLLASRLHRFITRHALRAMHSLMTGTTSKELEEDLESSRISLSALSSRLSRSQGRTRVRLTQSPF